MKYLLFEYPFAEDWRKWDCISFEINLPQESPVELSITVYPLSIGRPEYIKSTSAKVITSGESWQKIEIGHSQFDYKHAAGAFWRFIKKAELLIDNIPENIPFHSLIRNVQLKQKGVLYVECDKYSFAADCNDTVYYDYLISNQSEKTQAVGLSLNNYGWESMTAEIIPDKVVLKPKESKKCILKINLNDRVAPGGYEKHRLIIVPNGDLNYAKELEFTTVCKLPHPYLLHDEKGWQDISDKVKKYKWAQEALEHYIEIAEKWLVPEVCSGTQAFDLTERHNIEASAIAWKLTHHIEFGNKLALFLKRLADPVHGYPATRSSIFHSVPVPLEMNNESTMIPKICTGTLIHEGEFLMDVAAAYDLIYDEDFLLPEEKTLIEKSFRTFIEKIDWAITDGDCNNIPSGAMAAAIFCSLVLQDMNWVHRFLYGYNGVLDLLAITVLDDGWYFEGATNYVLLGAHIYTRIAQALLPWGINLKDAYVPARYSSTIMLTPWSQKVKKSFLGMSFEKQGPNTKNYHSIVDFWDGLLPFVDYRGILFAINDSTEKDISNLYELAYHIYGKPEYVTVIRNSGKRDLLYGVPELPEVTEKPFSVSAYADNVGIAMLRSLKSGRKQREQMQVVLRYGTHGGYHGHFDRTDLVSIMRYGKSIYNTEASWYGYGSYLFKMWVQNSISHNMITVDQRMQEPAASKRLMFYSGKHIQTVAVETSARWFDPPYGGQTPYLEQFPEEKCWKEGRYIPTPDVPRNQGDTGKYSDYVRQRRMVIVTNDYIIFADWVTSDSAHEFDNWLHLSGYKGITAKELVHFKHTGKLNNDPYGGGQFITDCDWYNVQAPAVASFGYEYDKEKDSKKVFTLFNEDGYMNVDVHSLWPLNSQLMVGNHPEPDNINKKLTYEVTGDDKVLVSGNFGAWILGNGYINVDLKGIQKLQIKVWIEAGKNTRKTIFLGDPYILTEDGTKVYLSDITIQRENVSSTEDSNIDYYGGPVKLEGIAYEKAIGIEPKNLKAASSITVDLSEIKGAIQFISCIGGDYPLGNEDKQRKALSIRTCGKEAKYITILELHENNKLIESAEAVSENIIAVKLKDGRIHNIAFHNFYEDDKNIFVNFCESKDGVIINEEVK